MINIYSTQTCGKCKIIKKYCEDNNIPFVEIDVNENILELTKLQNNKMINLPVIENINTNELYSDMSLFNLKKMIEKWEAKNV